MITRPRMITTPSITALASMITMQIMTTLSSMILISLENMKKILTYCHANVLPTEIEISYPGCVNIPFTIATECNF